MDVSELIVTEPRPIYLDNAATTMVDKTVLRAMRPYMEDGFANPNSVHTMGLDAKQAVDLARATVAKSIGAPADSIVFTSGGSEANTMAILGVASHLKRTGKTHVVTTQLEHSSVLSCMQRLADMGFEITYVQPTASGVISSYEIEKEITEKTGLVSVMAVNNEIGSMNKYISIGQMCTNKGVLSHFDCVQAYGHTEIMVDECCADFITASSHKIHGPKGVGFLYARNKELLSPIICGGGQEFGLRGGTQNVPGIVGFAKAAELCDSYRVTENRSYIEYKKTLLKELKNRIGETFSMNGEPRLASNIINIKFDNVDGETLLLLLSSRGVMVSAGSACDSHSAVPSRVLTAIGLTDEDARSSIRISFSRDTTNSEVLRAASIIAESVLNLRQVQAVN